MPVALYRSVGTAGKRVSKPRRSEISLTVPGLDVRTYEVLVSEESLGAGSS